jgi:hypothetical protein
MSDTLEKNSLGRPGKTLNNQLKAAIIQEVDSTTWLVWSAFGEWSGDLPSATVARHGRGFACSCGIAAGGRHCPHVVALWRLKLPIQSAPDCSTDPLVPLPAVRIEFPYLTTKRRAVEFDAHRRSRSKTDRGQ